ncbi:MAG TPA: hypothetical protein VIA61_18645, partial [Methylomirabilota bacterium]
TPHLKRDGLKGARIGIPRAFFYDPVTPPGETAPRGGLTPDQAAAMAEAIEVLRREGAVTFTGAACSEPRLIELGYAFEQATKRRVPPPSTP